MRFTFNGQLKGEKFFWRIFPSSTCSFFAWIFQAIQPVFSNRSASFPDTVSIRRGYLASSFCFACTVDNLHRDLSETSKLQKRIPAKSKPGLTGLRGSLTPDVTSRVLKMKRETVAWVNSPSQIILQTCGLQQLFGIWSVFSHRISLEYDFYEPISRFLDHCF